MQAPIKDRYKGDPWRRDDHAESQRIARRHQTLPARVETGRARYAVAGLHPATGGSGLELCSGGHAA